MKAELARVEEALAELPDGVMTAQQRADKEELTQRLAGQCALARARQGLWLTDDGAAVVGELLRVHREQVRAAIVKQLSPAQLAEFEEKSYCRHGRAPPSPAVRLIADRLGADARPPR
jgi:hypothetical protein